MRSPALKYARANSGLTFRPDANTVLWLPGQDDAYSSTIRDRSGYGNDGTITNVTWEKLSSGLWVMNLAPGGNGKVVFSHTAELDPDTRTQPFTCMLWISATDTTVGKILQKRAVGSYPYSFQKGTTQMSFVCYDGSTAESVDIFNATHDGIWRHICGRVNSTDLQVYLNGVPGSSTANNMANDPGNAADVNLFTENDGGGNWAGRIALVKLINSELSQEAIRSHYNQERHLFGV